MEAATGPTPAARAPRRGERLEVEIESLAFGGRGVARAEGFVLFVAGALPGDRVRAEVTKGKKRFAEARTVELLRPGAERVDDRCVHGGEPCPGAPWQGLAYERQLAHKQEQVDEALRRLGGLDGFELEEIVPAVAEWRYRNKLEYSFGAADDEGEVALGFHARGRWDLIVDVDDCKLASEPGNSARNALRQWAPRRGRARLRRPRPRRRPAQPGRPRGAAHRPDPDPPRHLARRSCRGRRSTSTR